MSSHANMTKTSEYYTLKCRLQTVGVGLRFGAHLHLILVFKARKYFFTSGFGPRQERRQSGIEFIIRSIDWVVLVSSPSILTP